MNKDKLFGWSYMKGQSFKECDLSVVPHPDNVSFDSTRHMSVCGWPRKNEDRLEIAQRLSVMECNREVFEKPTAVS